jgi:hypothetical protein
MSTDERSSKSYSAFFATFNYPQFPTKERFFGPSASEPAGDHFLRLSWWFMRTTGDSNEP